MTERRLDDNTDRRLSETITIYKTSGKLLLDWKQRLMRKCRECLRAKRDKTVAKNSYDNSCDCDVQIYLDKIIKLLGNGHVVNGE